MEALTRLSKQWSPFGRRLVVTGVITGYGVDGSPRVALDPAARMAALSSAWADPSLPSLSAGALLRR